MTDEQYVRTVFQERLGIYSMERGHFETSRVSDNETCLNVLASSAFLKGGNGSGSGVAHRLRMLKA